MTSKTAGFGKFPYFFWHFFNKERYFLFQEVKTKRPNEKKKLSLFTAKKTCM
jgi:hypothetical protein